MSNRLLPRRLWSLTRDAAIAWWDHNCFRLAASLAFYTIFSFAPMLVIAIAVAGAFFGEEVASRQLVTQIDGLVGRAGAEVVRSILENASRSRSGFGAALLGTATLVVGSTAVFADLQTALNEIWGVQVKASAGTVRSLVRSRASAFAVVLGVGFLLLVSLALSTVLAATQEYLSERVLAMPRLWSLANAVVSLGMTFALFLLIYKVLPDVQLGWSDVAVGAVVTAALFSVGKFLIGQYLGRASIGSSYGAAGSFAVLLIWIYYSALVSFYGAEFTQVFHRARHRGRVEPESYAELAPRVESA